MKPSRALVDLYTKAVAEDDVRCRARFIVHCKCAYIIKLH